MSTSSDNPNPSFDSAPHGLSRTPPPTDEGGAGKPGGSGAPDPLAVALSKLDPAPHGFDWNKLMFAAGRASKARALWFWRVTAGVCALAAVGFAVAYFSLALR